MIPKAKPISRILSSVAIILLFFFLGLILIFVISPIEGFLSVAVIAGFWAYTELQFRYKLVLTLFMVPILPVIISCGLAITDYSTGTPFLRTFGLLRGPVYDYETRLQFSSSGCTVSGLEFLTYDPYNKTLRLLSRTFGYAKSAYQGILPKAADAQNFILTQGKRLSIADSNIKIPSVHGTIIVDVDSVNQIRLKVLFARQDIFFYDYSPDVIIIGLKSAENREKPYVLIRSLKNAFIQIS